MRQDERPRRYHSGRSMRMARKRQKKGFRLWKLPLYLLGIILLLGAGLLLFLTVTEYRPAESEGLIMSGGTARTLSPGDIFTLMS